MRGVILLVLLQLPGTIAQGECVLEHCAGPLLTCGIDTECRQWQSCMFSCKPQTNISCQIRCGDLYSNQKICDFSTCVISENHCVPPRKDTCVKPARFASAFDLSSFAYSGDGHWFISAGWNPLFDCFDCQSHRFTFSTSSDPPRLFGRLAYKVRVNMSCVGGTADCHYIQRETNQSWIQDPVAPGHLINHNNNTFMHYADDWYVLASKPGEYILVYYCGCNDAWCGYSGAVLYTRTRSLSAGIRGEVEAAIVAAAIPEFSYQSLCFPDSTGDWCAMEEPGQVATFVV